MWIIWFLIKSYKIPKAMRTWLQETLMLWNMMELGSILQTDTLKIYRDTHRRVPMKFEIYKFAQDNILTPIGAMPSYSTRSIICM